MFRTVLYYIQFILLVFQNYGTQTNYSNKHGFLILEWLQKKTPCKILSLQPIKIMKPDIHV